MGKTIRSGEFNRHFLVITGNEVLHGTRIRVRQFRTTFATTVAGAHSIIGDLTRNRWSLYSRVAPRRPFLQMQSGIIRELGIKGNARRH
jgi:hypothetical protein